MCHCDHIILTDANSPGHALKAGVLRADGLGIATLLNAILPLMGAVGDHYGMSRAFIVPMVCFAFVAFYGFSWLMLSKSEGVRSLNAGGGHRES